jgi:hypothetical protein
MQEKPTFPSFAVFFYHTLANMKKRPCIFCSFLETHREKSLTVLLGNLKEDPDPDPEVFGPPGSFHQQANNLDFYSFVTF